MFCFFSPQTSSTHHPYTRQSREDRLRCIQRRLGLNPDTGKPFASRSINQSAAAAANTAAPVAEPTKEFVSAATAAAKASAAARTPLLGSSAFTFAMKQRSLAAQTKPAQQNPLLPISLSSTYKKRSQSSSSEDTTASASQQAMPTLGISASLYPSGVTPRARSLSSPSGSVGSQPEVVSTHFSHPETLSTHVTETSAVPTQPSSVESSVQERESDYTYEQSTVQYQADPVNQVNAGDQPGTASCDLTGESDMLSPQDQTETMSYQTDIYQSESDYLSSPEKVSHEYESQKEYYEDGKQEEQQKPSQKPLTQSEKPKDEEWVSINYFLHPGAYRQVWVCVCV